MKVLILGPLPPPIGGATVLFNELSNYLKASKNVDCEIINTTSKGKGKLTRLLFSFNLIYKIISKIKRNDLVFFHASLRGAYQFGYIVKIICVLFNKPLGFRGFGGHYYNWYLNANLFKKWLLRHGVLSADMVLFETRQLIQNFSSIINSNYVWYPNSRYIYSDSIERTSCQKLVFIGHVKPTKGVYDLIAVAESLPDSVTIDVYGPIQEGVEESDFEHESVSYKGVLKPDQVLSTLAKYDALVFPTYYEGEGYPGVILEAYACGLPVISTNWKMIPEIVDGTSGILVEPENPAQLLEAITKITTDLSFYKSLREGTQKKAKTYDMNIWNEKFIDLCHELAQVNDV